MRIKKALSMLCVTALLMTSVAVPCVYADTASDDETITKTVSYVNDDFEDGDLSDWYFRADASPGTKTATIITEENGNKFLRLSYTGLQTNSDGKVVAYSKKFSDGKFLRDMDNCTVLEMKVRTNSYDLRKYIKYNYPTSGTKNTNGYNEIGYNLRVALAMTSSTSNGVTTGNFRSTWSHVGGTNPQTFMQGNLETLITYDLDKWYTVKSVWNNKDGKADMYIYNENGVLLTSYKNKNLNAWWFDYYDYNKTQPKVMDSIEDITIHFLNALDVTDEQFDLDDLRIFNQKSEVEAKVIPNTDVGIIYNPQELNLVFDAPVTVSENAITVVDSSGNTVAHNGSYNQETFTYTATFEQALTEGEYKFVIDPERAVPVNETVGMIQQMGFKENEISFSSYATMPPVADNVRIQGRVIPNTKIIADYDLISETQEGASYYEWYMCDSADGEFVKIDNQNAKEITVTNAMYEKYIKFKVKPVTFSGLEGTQFYESNVIVPEKAPVANNISFSSELYAKGTSITASYDFYDPNGDSEEGSEIEWFISDNGADGWNCVQSGKIFEIKDEYDGKYFKCVITPVSEGEYEKTGAVEESDVCGPIGDLIALTNKIVNGNFESGSVEPWFDQGIAIEITDDAYTGNYALRAHSRTTASQNFHQKINLEANKTYIVSGMVKSANMKTYSGYEAYNWMGTVEKLDRNNEMTEINDDWKRVTLSFMTPTAGQYAFGFMSFAAFDAEAIIDDVYLGELMISDIETYTLNSVTVPKGNDVVKVPVTTGKLFNQFNEQDGLTGQNVVVSVPDLPGVNVIDNIIVIDSSANSGTVEVTVSCIPSYRGAAQSEFIKKLELKVLSHDDTTPKALNVTANGDVIKGETLTGSYNFYQVEGKADASVVKWMYSDFQNGTYYDIPGATSLTYTVEDAYKDKFIRFCVIPKTTDGTTGEEAFSNILVKPTAPVATDVLIDGDFKIGGTVAAKYSFNDINADTEGASIYKWYIYDMNNGSLTQIPGQTEKTLVLTEDLTDKYIKFGVTPVSVNSPETGKETLSKEYIGPSAPSAYDLRITESGGRIIGSYTYFHPHNARELNSVYEWTIDGIASYTNEPNLVKNFAGVKLVTFSVTPVGDTNPSTGKKVSVSVYVAGNLDMPSGGTSGGTSGGFGGGGGYANAGTTSGVVNINNMQTVPETQDNTKVTDISGHWGEAYIKDMETRGVMKTDDKGNYNPDVNVSREEMVTFLFDALKLAESEYSSQFSDVKDGEFAKKLQTMLDNGTIAKDTNFRPNDTISREEMCKILYVSLKNAGKLAEVEDGLINTFADFDNISEWARVYVNAIYGNKIMVGVSDTEFDAKGTVTKAQAATMLVRILKLTEAE
ncbi:MAG: S-layer homology domain-containing protein [Clostridia bacterium]|nr:S-layer homology domain-containing protein [Clostridia bacterium]